MFYDIGKRLMDIFGSIVGILVFTPIMLSTALFIKAVSPDGPILADQKPRVGKDWNEFKMFKFRSMVPGAQDILKNNPELYKKYQANGYKLDPDPRLIKGAKYLRKYSIDEMPQFFNILLGNMSLVGPRAYFAFELEEQVKKHPEADDYVNQALTVKPGLTGPWQIGGRSEVNFVDRIKMDAEYAKSRSLMYDLKVILRTPYVVITSKGAV
jgi:exopolysaccharide production protein ExoY